MIKVNEKKRKRYWFIGLLIGLLIGFCILLLNFIVPSFIAGSEFLSKLVGGLMLPSAYLISPFLEGCNDIMCLIWIIPFFLLPLLIYGAIGLILGLIIGRFIKK